MAWTYSVGDLRTGQISEVLPLSGVSWSRPLNDAGTVSGALDLEDPDNVALDPRTCSAPARSFVFVEHDGAPVCGGVIWTHRYTRKPSRSLQIGAAGLWSLWDHRKVLPALTYAQAPGEAADTVLPGLSLETIAKRLVQQAIAHTGGNVPLVLPADVTGTAERRVNAYELADLGHELKLLTGVLDGPDIEFVPRRVAGDESRIEWVMRVGTPLEQAGDPWVWDDSVAESAVVDLGVDIDGSKLAARGWVPGVGTEREQLRGLHEDMTLVAAGYPLLEVEDTSHTQTAEQDTLDDHAADLVARRATPLEQWSLSVRADVEPALGTYQPGDTAIVQLEGDPYIPDGEHLVRILAMSGSSDEVVRLEVAPDLAIV